MGGPVDFQAHALRDQSSRQSALHFPSAGPIGSVGPAHCVGAGTLTQ
ncbi:MAG: hypothetical protein LBF24_03040 [Puniceicoccales bacterium]|nr:hypothetical protein [Puniceicoccales bacterium]